MALFHTDFIEILYESVSFVTKLEVTLYKLILLFEGIGIDY